MALTTIDPTTALVVIDLQKGIVAVPTVHPIDDVVRHSAELATAFRRHGLPVVLVTVTGRAPGRIEPSPAAVTVTRAPDSAELVPELQAQPSDYQVIKQRWGAFTGTSLDQYLRDRGVTQVVLTGVSTSAGVESTARSAHELGYHVVLATDAMTDRRAEAHRNSVELVFPRLGETGTTAEILETLEKTRDPS